MFVASQGQWLIASLNGQGVAPGFYLLVVLDTESLSAKGCVDGSIKLQNGDISTPLVRRSEVVMENPGE